MVNVAYAAVMVRETLVIAPGASRSQYWGDLWRYRELFWMLAWRDVAVRYKQTVFGLAWALLQPLVTMLVFTVVFGRVARLPSMGNVPYSVMVFAGLLPWMLFSSALSGQANSLITNSSLISKVYFPRIIIPAATAVVAAVDFLVGFVLLGGMMLWNGLWPSWRVLVLPLLIAMAVLTSIGPGLWMAGMNVRYRDFRYVVPFVVQFGVYVSPVGFTSAVVPVKWKSVYFLNPMAGVIDGFRWALFPNASPLDVPGFLTSWAVILVLLWMGVRRFRAVESSLADLI